MPSTPPAPATETVEPSKRSGSGRLPSLNQLAARINLNNGTPSSHPLAPANRPRLAASLLRTGSGSTTSLSTTTSTADSIAVNAPSTRTPSPGFDISTPTSTSNSVVDDAGDDQLTAEKLETLDKLTQEPTTLSKKSKVGYKNIPSLDAITARLAKARSLSVDGSSKPPEPETIEDPQTPGLRVKAPEHPLEYPWTFFHDTKNAKVPPTPAGGADLPSAHFLAPESDEYEAGLTVVGEFDTVESFCRYFNWLKPPSKLEKNSNYHLFKSGIKPMWEDDANANGGKWVLTMKNNPQLLDRCWIWLAMALVGEDLDEGDEICGAVVSLRSKVDRIQLWTRSKDDVEKINGIGRKMVKLLDVSEADGVGLEFQFNSDDRPQPNKFLSIQAVPQTSYRSSFTHGRNTSTGGTTSPFTSPIAGPGEGPNPPTAGSGGASTHFGVGGGGALGNVLGWRGKKG